MTLGNAFFLWSDDPDVIAMTDAAFAALAARHPECGSGDVNPEDLQAVRVALATAASEWLRRNTP